MKFRLFASIHDKRIPGPVDVLFQDDKALRWSQILLVLLLTVIVVLFLGGCMAVEEGTADMDFVIGPGYEPHVDRTGNYIPSRILLLPLTGHIDDRYKREFINSFRSELNNEAPWTVVEWPDGSLGYNKLEVQREEAVEIAARLHCDAILFVRIEDSSIFPPLRMCIRLTLEETMSGNAILYSFQDYDTANKLVANAARSFYQSNLNKQANPDRSLNILNSNPPFIKYVSAESAISLKDAVHLVQKQDTSADSAEKSSSSSLLRK